MQANECFSAIHYNWGDQSWGEFIERIGALGIRGIELLHLDVQGKSSAELRTIRRTFDAADMIAVAVGVGNDFCQRKGTAEFAREIEEVKQRIDAAHILGTTILRLEGGQPKADLSYDQQWDAVRAGVEAALPLAQAAEVQLALDNHGSVTNDGERLGALLAEFDDAHLGACIDPSNFRWFGHPLACCEAFIHDLAPRALHAHLKNGDGQSGKMNDYTATALDEGEIDIASFIKRLVDCGYQGAWCLEYEGPPPTDAGIARGAAYARDVLADCGVELP